jgi:hypothetical protein
MGSESAMTANVNRIPQVVAFSFVNPKSTTCVAVSSVPASRSTDGLPRPRETQGSADGILGAPPQTPSKQMPSEHRELFGDSGRRPAGDFLTVICYTYVSIVGLSTKNAAVYSLENFSRGDENHGFYGCFFKYDSV